MPEERGLYPRMKIRRAAGLLRPAARLLAPATPRARADRAAGPLRPRRARRRPARQPVAGQPAARADRRRAGAPADRAGARRAVQRARPARRRRDGRPAARRGRPTCRCCSPATSSTSSSGSATTWSCSPAGRVVAAGSVEELRGRAPSSYRVELDGTDAAWLRDVRGVTRRRRRRHHRPAHPRRTRRPPSSPPPWPRRPACVEVARVRHPCPRSSGRSPDEHHPTAQRHPLLARRRRARDQHPAAQPAPSRSSAAVLLVGLDRHDRHPQPPLRARADPRGRRRRRRPATAVVEQAAAIAADDRRHTSRSRPTTYDDAAAAEQAVRDGDVDAALLPTASGAGYDLVGDDDVDPTVAQARLAGGQPAQVTQANADRAGRRPRRPDRRDRRSPQRLLDPDADNAGLRQVGVVRLRAALLPDRADLRDVDRRRR